MKPFRTLPMAAIAALAACVPQPKETPPAPPPPAPAPPPAPVPPPAPPVDWADIPLTSGDWHYRDEGQVSSALFGPPASEAAFIVRCDKAQGRLTLLREGSAPGAAMRIRTSFTARDLPTLIQSQPLAYTYATLDARDPLLDSMAFSRGRFTVETGGLPMLVLPAWPEPARVVEDCRR